MKRILTTLSQKWPEYLLEILVLIIGIYGAFALDNWNEERKERRAELELLSNLKSDFVTRLEEMRDIQRVRTEIIGAIDTLYHIANTKDLDRGDSEFDKLLMYMYISYRFNDEFSSLDMLFSSGGINNISNKNLKEKLIKWPWYVEEMLEEQERIEEQLPVLISILAEYISANNLYKQFPDEAMTGNLSIDTFENDYEGLLKNRIFIDGLVHKRAYLAFNLKDGKVIIDLCQEIITLIDQEIEKL